MTEEAVLSLSESHGTDTKRISQSVVEDICFPLLYIFLSFLPYKTKEHFLDKCGLGMIFEHTFQCSAQTEWTTFHKIKIKQNKLTVFASVQVNPKTRST